MKKNITFFCLALIFTSCSTDKKKSLTTEQTKADSTATTLAEGRSMVAKSTALLDSMDGAKTLTSEQINAADEQANAEEPASSSDIVGEYDIHPKNNHTYDPIKIEKEYDDYYVSEGYKGRWTPRKRLIDMDVEQVESKFGRSANQFLEMAMVSEGGMSISIYKVKKGMHYDGQVFKTDMMVDMNNYEGIHPLYKKDK
ncbi:hypothetical protein [Hymenobacter sp. UYCo722]|uniref:hypothetical protein n=1 Tax=Hymenobacter sp. UYCo722 TaxID=3156335 RepID=UPI003391B2DB